MLIAIFISLFLVFSGTSGVGLDQFGELMSKHVKDQIKVVVADSGQRALALDQLSAVNKNLDAVNKLIEQDMKKFTKLIEDYNSTPADFEQLLASASVKNKNRFDSLWSDRQALLSHIQPDEWAAIIAGAQAEMQKKEKL